MNKKFEKQVKEAIDKLTAAILSTYEGSDQSREEIDAEVKESLEWVTPGLIQDLKKGNMLCDINAYILRHYDKPTADACCQKIQIERIELNAFEDFVYNLKSCISYRVQLSAKELIKEFKIFARNNAPLSVSECRRILAMQEEAKNSINPPEENPIPQKKESKSDEPARLFYNKSKRSADELEAASEPEHKHQKMDSRDPGIT